MPPTPVQPQPQPQSQSQSQSQPQPQSPTQPQPRSQRRSRPRCRAAHPDGPAGSTDRFHEPRRPDCPWCGSGRLRTRTRTPDLRRHRPGTSVVDDCEDCAHAFRNPRPTAEGLAFHHRRSHESQDRDRGRRHRAAARAMLPFPEPESWLDVGTGHGHFPEAAKELFAYTSFDGTDPTARIERARTAGRVEEAYRGRLPDLAGRLRARYDVVSMFHHLEHSPDPREELRAALAVLRPGGHLLVEVPDPDRPFGALLGKRWVSCCRPQHLHLMPLRNLLAELDELGCSVVSTGRREPHVPYDPTGALAPLLRRTRLSNAYRIIARKNPRADACATSRP